MRLNHKHAIICLVCQSWISQTGNTTVRHTKSIVRSPSSSPIIPRRDDQRWWKGGKVKFICRVHIKHDGATLSNKWVGGYDCCSVATAQIITNITLERIRRQTLDDVPDPCASASPSRPNAITRGCSLKVNIVVQQLSQHAVFGA